MGSSFRAGLRALTSQYSGSVCSHPLQCLSSPRRVSQEESQFHQLILPPAAPGVRKPWRLLEPRKNWTKGWSCESWLVLGVVSSLLSLITGMSQAGEPCPPEVSSLGQKPVVRAISGTCVTKATDSGWGRRCARVGVGKPRFPGPNPQGKWMRGGGDLAKGVLYSKLQAHFWLPRGRSSGHPWELELAMHSGLAGERGRTPLSREWSP